MDADQRLTFEGFSLDLASRQLVCEGEVVALTPKAFAVLHRLAEEGGQLVTKAELLRAGSIAPLGGPTYDLVDTVLEKSAATCGQSAVCRASKLPGGCCNAALQPGDRNVARWDRYPACNRQRRLFLDCLDHL